MYTHIPQRAAAEIPARMCVPLAPTANALRRCRSQGGASARHICPRGQFQVLTRSTFSTELLPLRSRKPPRKNQPTYLLHKNPPPESPNPENLQLRTKSYDTCARLRPCSQMEQIRHRGFCRRAQRARLPGNWVPAEAPSQWRFRFPEPRARTKPQGWR